MAKPPGNKRGVHPSQTTSQQPQVPFAIQSQLTQGPIPNASEMARYEQVLPGSAARILTMAEKNQERRQASEEFADKSNRLIAEANSRAMDANVRASDAASIEAKRGQWMAFTIAILFLAASVGLALAGREIASSVIGGGVLVALVAAFLKKSPK